MADLPHGWFTDIYTAESVPTFSRGILRVLDTVSSTSTLPSVSLTLNSIAGGVLQGRMMTEKGNKSRYVQVSCEQPLDTAQLFIFTPSAL